MKEVEQELWLVRNFTAAHNEQNSLKQLDVIKAISTDRIELISLGIYGIFLQIHEYEKIFKARAKLTNSSNQSTTPKSVLALVSAVVDVLHKK